MNIVPNNRTVVDYCDDMEAGKIIVNPNYQRSSKVWPDIAKSFLVETIMLGLPVPKLSLFQKTDIKSRKTINEIVDGQQRSTTILQFYRDELRLSRSLETEEIAGKKFSQLSEEYQAKFIQYRLSIDQFIAATPAEVREIFRRMNSYTVPLNPEEQRHASYQGPFKWFIYKMAHEYDTPLVEIGAFTDKQVIRMSDAKLLTEICHAFIYGITTTNKKSLDALYKSRDQEYEEQTLHGKWLRLAFDHVLRWKELHRTRMVKPYMLYSLVLAIVHASEPLARLQTQERPGGGGVRSSQDCVRNLSTLLEALDMDELDLPMSRFESFLNASSSKTNTQANRRTRFEWLYDAVTKEQV